MERTEKFFTVEDNQNSIKIVVYEADDKRRQIELTDGKKISSENNCVRFDTQVPKETPIAVTFRLDESGVLFVSAKSLVDSGHVDFQLQLKGVMSQGAMMAAKDNVANTATR
jgi:molecular chaperone DnaK (HSP70)